MDFTQTIYIELLKIIIKQNYTFQIFKEFIAAEEASGKIIMLRHDVDKLPYNALEIAQLENIFNIKGTYYFRIVPGSLNLEIIEKIAGLRHEIGYHYEEMDTVSKKYKDKRKKVKEEDLIDEAYDLFCKNLEKMRQVADIKTICMHGSPLSKFDNKAIWKKYNYKDLKIIGEPYFDVNYSEIFYITDTGRKWNNETSNVRDTVKNRFSITVNSTNHLIRLFEENKMPFKVMINSHPHRWFNYGFNWYKELIGQNIKNVAKSLVVRFR